MSTMGELYCALKSENERLNAEIAAYKSGIAATEVAKSNDILKLQIKRLEEEVKNLRSMEDLHKDIIRHLMENS
jgi:hypothetical protein